MAINTAIITTPGAAVKAQAEVKRKRSVAKALAKDGDITGARFELAEAADLDRAAAAILDPSKVLLNPLVAGRGGELVVPTKENMMDRPGLVDTANSDPDMLTAAASVALPGRRKGSPDRRHDQTAFQNFQLTQMHWRAHF